MESDPLREPGRFSAARDAITALQQEWQRSDAVAADLPLDATIDWRGEAMSLRFVYLHVIHEYARHNGHADLIREAIDGAVGR